MDKEQFEKTIQLVRKTSPKRKFKQSFDLIINLKDVNLKDTSNQIDSFIALHHSKGKKTKICALVGPELSAQAKEACDFSVEQQDFIKYEKEKKLTKKLAKEYDFFIAQANIMPDVAKCFGRVLGPKGKMPNPKAGCVVPPNANLKQLYERLKNMVRIVAKTSPSIKVMVGNEEMKDEEVLDNIMTVFKQVLVLLPSEKNNVKNIFLKLTMGKALKVGSEMPAAESEKDEKQQKPKAEKKQKEQKEDSEQ